MIHWWKNKEFLQPDLNRRCVRHSWRLNYNFTFKILSTVFSSVGHIYYQFYQIFAVLGEKNGYYSTGVCWTQHMQPLHSVLSLHLLMLLIVSYWVNVMLFCHHSRSDPLIQRALLAGDHIACLNTGFQRSCRISVNHQVTGAHEVALRKQYGNQLQCES